MTQPEFDAIVLAGGRGSRAGGAAKVLGVVGGSTLLGRAVAACARGRVVVVGPPDLAPYLEATALVREEPPFAGPVAAIDAGCAALPRPAPWTLVLAADHVDPAAAVDAVLTAARDAAAIVDGVIAVDEDDRAQYLLALYRSDRLRDALAALPTVEGVSVRALIRGLRLSAVRLAPGAARDVDTPGDALAAGVTLPPGRTMDA